MKKPLNPPRGYKNNYEVGRRHPRSRIRKKYQRRLCTYKVDSDLSTVIATHKGKPLGPAYRAIAWELQRANLKGYWQLLFKVSECSDWTAYIGRLHCPYECPRVGFLVQHKDGTESTATLEVDPRRASSRLMRRLVAFLLKKLAEGVLELEKTPAQED